MKQEDQLTNREIAKKLCDLGVKQGSLCYWIDKLESNYEWDDWYIVSESKKDSLIEEYESSKESLNFYSAYTVAELGVLLPGYIVHKVKNYRLQIQKWCNRWQIYYECTDQENLGEYLNDFLQLQEDTEANARGKMLIYLLENKLIKIGNF